MNPAKILFCLTVRDGRCSALQCIRSAQRLDSESAAIDLLVLDDASCEPGLSDELRQLSAELHFHYYRTPRRLGDPRNINLGLLAGAKYGYDYVFVSDSDLLFPKNLLIELLKPFESSQVGLVTSWSTVGMSPYCLQSHAFPANQNMVDWVGITLAGGFSGTAVDVPAIAACCILMRISVVKEVGLMDPVFGYGPCHDTDWSLRAGARGYRMCLVPSVLVPHQGEPWGIDVNSSAAHSNEAIVDLRYPGFRAAMAALPASLAPQKDKAVLHIIEEAARQFGYFVEIGWPPASSKTADLVRVYLSPTETEQAEADLSFQGFRASIPCEPLNLASRLRQRFGRDPSQVRMLDRGGMADRLRACFDRSIVRDLRNYPARV